MTDKFLKGVGTVVVSFMLIATLGLINGYPIKWIVNYLFAPGVLIAVFGVSKITFWQAFWLNFLASQLFKTSKGGK